MKVIRKIGFARHFLAIAVLALTMGLFVSGSSRASTGTKNGLVKDPVISGMSWDDGGTSALKSIDLGNGPYALCDGNCNPNCPGNCDGNCDGNCNGNCNPSCNPGCTPK